MASTLDGLRAISNDAGDFKSFFFGLPLCSSTLIRCRTNGVPSYTLCPSEQRAELLFHATRAGYTAHRRSELQALYAKFEGEIEKLNQRVEEQAYERPGALLLMTHPGVGPVTALATDVHNLVIGNAPGKDQQEMKLVSVNTGFPREVIWHGRSVTTAIYKRPVEGRVALRKLNLDGDRQADLSVHGGEHKAVYCYPIAHYGYWKRELPGRELPMGIFGENFTTDGLLEGSVHLGDHFSVGSAEVVVAQPRLPCYKLGVRFQADDMVKRFLASGRTGFYLGVTREGEVGAGDEIKVIARDSNAVPVSEITRLYIAKRYGEEDVMSVRRALRVAALPESWKAYFRERLQKMNA